MAYNFPNSPLVGDTYSFNNATWEYSGSGWALLANPVHHRKLDDISSGFNGSNTGFTLSVGSSNITPVTATTLLISVNGVLQEPDTSYSVSGSTITFTEAPTAGSTFYGVALSYKTETINTVADGSISSAKLVSTGVTAATYGNASIVPVITVDAQGRITSASNTTISAGITTGKAIAMAMVFG